MSGLPYTNHGAERAVLGSIMLSPSCFAEAKALLAADDFGDLSHCKIFAAMETVEALKRAIDPTTVADALKSLDALDAVGGPVYLVQLEAACLAPENIKSYCEIVLDHAHKRAARQMLEQARKQLGSGADADEVFADIDKVSEAFHRRASATDGPVHIGDAVYEVLEETEQARLDGVDIIGLSSGYADLDLVTSGFQPSDLIILAASPSVGKTSLASCFTENIAVGANQTVLCFSCEMSLKQIAKRQIAVNARGDLSLLNRPRMISDDQMQGFVEAGQNVGAAPIYVDDTPAIDAYTLRSRARNMVATRGGIALIIVDYLQLLTVSSARSDNRNLEIARISATLKQTARECDCPIIVLSQINRDSRKAKAEPELHNLRDSGAIEQDADLVIFLHEDPDPCRDIVLDQNGDPNGVRDVWALIKKNRNGPTGRLRLPFKAQETRFYNAPGGLEQ